MFSVLVSPNAIRAQRQPGARASSDNGIGAGAQPRSGDRWSE